MRMIEKIEPTVPQIKRKKRVAAYARVSMETDRLNHSLSAQISYYSELIQKHPEWEYAGVYADSFISGTSTKNRTEFQRMIADCEAGKIDILLAKSISRFARNTVDLLETVRHLKNIGVEVRFEKEGISSTNSSGEIMLSILASFAQEESISISNNVKWGVRKRFEQGIPNNIPRAYGYQWDGEKLVIIPEEAAVVKRIFQNFLDGKSRLETEREFAAEGITTRSGCRWEDSNIKVVLTNITYTGNLLLQKEYIESPLTHKKKKNRGELPQYFVSDTHETIIDKETFDYVQSEMARRKELGPLANKSLNITCFTGKIKCEKCGKSMMRSTRINKVENSQLGEKLITWMCGTRKSGNGHCTTKEIPERILFQICSEALGTDEFDEEIFNERVNYISVPTNGELTFHFKSGSEKTVAWTNTSKKDAWTEELRAKMSDYRRNHPPLGKKGVSCFTTKIKCCQCGANYRRFSQMNKLLGKKMGYWRCSSVSGCTVPGLREDYLQNLICDVLNLDTFDEHIFLERIDHITVDTANLLTFFMKDGSTIIRKWEKPKKQCVPWTEQRKAEQSKRFKDRHYTPEMRKLMSELMKQIRRERGNQWRKK